MPIVFSHSATGRPSCSAKWLYPPPGQTTIAAPLAFPFGGRKGVKVGMSSGSLPSAPGAPEGQRAIAFSGAFAKDESMVQPVSKRVVTRSQGIGFTLVEWLQHYLITDHFVLTNVFTGDC